MEKEDGEVSFVNWASPYAYLVLIVIAAISFVLIFWHLQFYLFSGLDSVWYSYSAALYSRGEWLSPKATFKGPIFTLLLSLFFRVFGPTFWASRSVSVFFGGLMPIIVYFLAKQLFDKKIGLLSAFFCAINPLLILYSCLTFREILFSFTWMCCIYFSIRGLKGSRFHATLSGIAFGLSSMIIESGLFIAVGVIVYYLLVPNFLREEEQCRLCNIEIFLISGVVAIFPLFSRNYFVYGQWRYFWYFTGFMALGILFAFFVRMWHKHNSTVRIDRSRAIVLSILTFAALVAMVTLIEHLRGFVVDSIVGFVKLFEYVVLPESLGLLALFCILGIVQALKSDKKAMLPLCVFLFSIAPLAVAIPSHYRMFANVSLEELIFRHEIWPMENTYRYLSSFVPLLTIFASYGIFAAADKLSYLGKIERRGKLKTIVVSVLVLFVILQFLYSDVDIRLRAGADLRVVKERYDAVIDWLNAQGCSEVYSYNPLLQNLYGKDTVVLLSNESFRDILERALDEKTRFIISDTFGSYSDEQMALFWGGWVGNPEYWVPIDFNPAYSLTNWPLAQIYEISLPRRTALIVQHDALGEEWLSMTSNSSMLAKAVEENEGLVLHFSRRYDLIILADLQRHLKNNELSILHESVTKGAVLIVNGVSAFYLNLTQNGDWLGVEDFIETPKDAKSNITFTREAKNILNEIDIDENYCLYTDMPYSTPTGSRVRGVDTRVYAVRASDKVPVIFSRKCGDGAVIFSGVRPFFSSKAKDYDLYTKLLLGVLEMYLGT